MQAALPRRMKEKNTGQETRKTEHLSFQSELLGNLTTQMKILQIRCLDAMHTRLKYSDNSQVLFSHIRSTYMLQQFNHTR